ncbi:ABC transporter substrate-binding protein [Bradyrhizobium sp. CCGB12]|uniref:ABC transporter substrate-binding protein n=1 Tax=Bradyrhizobium sp. CCGB12 TaxID=2949632 RepID=UPI0020B2137A|nr:ABC transporter substrate-binding protein [Bradyrhizobium sp. CCGB12]MCP3394192.1 ABC transporter substrate-binding protein [Bradyrhizobium sp. CCGB12]
MRRRDVITLAIGAILAGLPNARAQQSSRKIWRLAFLNTDSWESEVQRALFDVFRNELQKLGYADGKNLVIERRAAEGNIERLDQLANELIAVKPDVMVAVATPAIAAAQRATTTIPIVMWGAGDAVALGLIKSLAHPGGNLTGVATMFSDTTGKSLELLHSILPAATRVAVLGSPIPTRKRQFEETEAAAKILGLVTIPIFASSRDDLGQAFERMVQEKCDALFVLAAPIEPEIVLLAARKKIPAVYQISAFVDLGGLASYGASLAVMGKQTAKYTARIFQGAKPAELPVEQPVAFELALNLKTAAALGLRIPAEVIGRADKVIE